MDSIIITLLSNILKGVGRDSKHGKKEGYTVLKADERAYPIHLTSAATHDHVMLSK